MKQNRRTVDALSRDSAADVRPLGTSEVDYESDGRPKPTLAATIMMVDDEPTTLEVLEEFLRGEGYTNIVTTCDSRKALVMLRAKNPDVLLLDLVMPDVGGMEILRSMRERETLQHTPVIILTSSSDPQTKLEALELGVRDFLAKTVDPSELALRLHNTLAAKAFRDRLRRYDDLTGLPNRRFFTERLDRALARTRGQELSCAALHIDLDRFKKINDALGHSVGDALLKAVAERLESAIRPNDLLGIPPSGRDDGRLSRVGSDEFSLFLPGIGSPTDAAAVARRILSVLTEPFWVEGHELFVTCSIGIAVSPDDGDDIDTLLRNADSAMSAAKKAGRNDYRFYSRSLNAESLDRLNLENQLRPALSRNELALHYQPQIDVQTGRIVGAEALMRWFHPEFGAVPPARFIPIAEEGGFIRSMGEWALMAACRQAVAWQEEGFKPIRMSINVSSLQFHSDGLFQTFAVALQDSGLDPRLLVVELTESQLMRNPEAVAYTLSGMKDVGLKISVDDFGTGYSSLATLKRFPIEELKIDRSFLKGIPDDGDDAAIATAIIQMAHTLGLTVVAEGVETEAQLAFLLDRGCDEYQGFLYSRAVPADEWSSLFEHDLTAGPDDLLPDPR